MAKLAFCFLVLFPITALADGRQPPPPPAPEATAVAIAAQAQGQLQGQAQQQQQTAQGGNATASIHEGAIVFQPGSIAMTDADTGGNNNSVEITNDNRGQVNAPPVYAPPVNPTAPYMKCFSIGGSGSNGDRAGGASGAWCWIARDVYAEQQFHTLAGMCMAEESAAAYCTKFNARPFGGVEQCKTKIGAGVAQYCNTIAQPPQPQLIHVSVDKPCCDKPGGDCPEKLKRCETHAAGKGPTGPKFKENCDGTPEDCLITE